MSCHDRAAPPAAIVCLFVLLCLSSIASPARAGLLDGVGAMGDSLLDEYQFYAADPGDRSNARSVVEILAARRSLNFGEFTTEARPSPRHQGYAYNWARTRSSAAASFDIGPGADFRPLTELGQHTGLAGQVAEGDVTMTMLFVGANDFLQYFLTPNPQPALGELVPRMAANTSEAVRTVLGANEAAKMVIFTLPDTTASPAAVGAVEEAVASGRISRERADALLAGISAAIEGYNSSLLGLADSVNQAAGEQRIAIADLHGMVEDEIYNGDGGTLRIAGLEIDKFRPGAGVEHLFLPDGIHPNTVFNGLMANLFIDTINEEFGAGLERMSEREIVDFATGVAAVPEPGSLVLLVVGAAGVVAVRRRGRVRRGGWGVRGEGEIEDWGLEV